ncbi:MAG: bifunctional 23S rRNA (guanine(2069)-N(7))-methyltransferase RlmK/23S rRNA (guanine(2445)-N(2))-methyltransferase RlmL [Magnetococcales bacterium]|nr:bifunctional 23S rRNA (guanine(2069)-N(7))-methyltransferase RlmK/23S rRNA (guanine(2445)-N(2))-methyltransferase RlmL [Magnetococcales bacterium]
MSLSLFATTSSGLESVLALELSHLGASKIRQRRLGVRFEADDETIYRALLWLRTAERVLLVLASGAAESAEALYETVKELPWEEHLPPDATFAVEATGTNAQLRHTGFTALKVKDAFVDRLRELRGERPSVNLRSPDIRIFVHIQGARADLGIDLSGERLHRRGYRKETGIAPMRETLAAGILLMAGWPERAREGWALADPMCGSGTFLIEGAMMAADMAPGLLRDAYGIQHWSGYDSQIWKRIRSEAEERSEKGLEKIPPILGSDHDRRAIAAATRNVTQAGLEDVISLACRSMPDAKGWERHWSRFKSRVLVTNPPYGQRLSGQDDLTQLYRRLGTLFAKSATSCGAVYTTRNEAYQGWPVSPRQTVAMRNGPMEGAVSFIGLTPVTQSQSSGKGPQSRYQERSHPSSQRRTGQGATRHQATQPPSVEELLARGDAENAQARMFGNRLAKNAKQLKKWLRREEVSCYRLYDADMPEFNFAVDCYGEWVHVQEYHAPKGIDPKAALKRRADALAVIRKQLQVASGNLFFKMRQRQKGAKQYRKLDEERRVHEVEEGGLRFQLNFTDYLDTGLFLDHRPVRAMIRERAHNARFLNLFAYTGSATVYAADGGARETTTVDLSPVYLAWAERNMRINGFTGEQHRFEQQDCLTWLESCDHRYDLIFLDPPTFSNSKRTETVFDINRDHPQLIDRALALLAPGGTLVFSTNSRSFTFQWQSRGEENSSVKVQPMHRETLHPDFKRRPDIHYCWFLIRP